jgi:nucleoside-diphosphate-sugar epimerase
MHASQPLLILGYGYLGKRLVQHCLRHATQVAVLTRSSAHADELDALGVDYQILDLDAPTAKLDLPLTGWGVIYTAPPGEGSPDRRLLSLLKLIGHGPRVFVYISTSGVYGDCGGRLVDESAPVNPGSERSRRRVSAENTVEAWAEAGGVRHVILRVPGIYGPDRLPISAVAQQAAFLEPEDSSPGNRIHVDDLVACCLAASDRALASGVFNVGDGNPLSATAFAQALAQATGMPPPRLVSRAEAASHISPGRWSFMSESRQLDTRRMREELQVQLRYGNPLDGLTASLEEMGLLPDDAI